MRGATLELVNSTASTMIVPLAITGALMYTIWNQLLIGYTFQGAFQRPIVCAFFFGLVSGRMEECMMLGAAIESLYLGVIACHLTEHTAVLHREDLDEVRQRVIEVSQNILRSL